MVLSITSNLQLKQRPFCRPQNEASGDPDAVLGLKRLKSPLFWKWGLVRVGACECPAPTFFPPTSAAWLSGPWPAPASGLW